MIIVDTDVKNQLSVPALLEGNDSEILGTPANYPAGQTGRLFFATNTSQIYYDNGTNWVVLIGGGSTGNYVTVTGTQTVTGLKTFRAGINIADINNTKSMLFKLDDFGAGILTITNQSLLQLVSLTNSGSLGAIAMIADNGLGIGQDSAGTGASLFINKLQTDGLFANGIKNQGTIQSTTTDSVTYYKCEGSTVAASFNLSNLVNFQATQGTIGVGSTVTNQYGFFVSSTLIGATNNYGFYGNIASGTNRWNFYAIGTANNFMAGALGIGATFLTAHNLRVDKNISGGTTSHGIYNGGTVQSDVTTQARYYTSAASTQATSFTLSDLRHYLATQGTFGVGSTVDTQVAFFADSTLIGATNNYGFRGQIASGTNRYNIYIDGTASNYLNGTTLIGSATDNNTGAKLQVTGNISYQNSLTRKTSSYTLVLTDQNKIVEMNVASSNNLTIPPNSSVAFPTGTEIAVVQYGAGQTTIVAGSGVTVRAASGNLKLSAQYAWCSLVKIGTNEWYVTGSLIA